MGMFSHFPFPKQEPHIPFRLEIRQEPATELIALVLLRKMFGNHLAARTYGKKGRFSPALCSPPSLLGTTEKPTPSRRTSELRPARARWAYVMQNSQPHAGPPALPAELRHSLPRTGKGCACDGE